MSDENPVEASAFVGIDPEDTLVVPFGGGKFTLGVLPAGIWDRISNRSMAAHQNAMRRAIASLHARGENPETDLSDGKGFTLLNQEMFSEPAYASELHSIQIEAIRFGLRGHEGFKNKNGRDFPFELRSDVVDGVAVEVVSEKTLKVYRVNTALLNTLWFSMRKLHELPDSAKKA